jgi:Lrp/AsnC family leucine-responsive transcriptional regulator
MKANDEVVACDYLTGDYDFMLKIHTRSSDSLEQLHRIIKSIKGVSATKTYFVLKEIKSGLTTVNASENE